MSGRPDLGASVISGSWVLARNGRKTWKERNVSPAGPIPPSRGDGDRLLTRVSAPIDGILTHTISIVRYKPYPVTQTWRRVIALSRADEKIARFVREMRTRIAPFTNRNATAQVNKNDKNIISAYTSFCDYSETNFSHCSLYMFIKTYYTKAGKFYIYEYNAR